MTPSPAAAPDRKCVATLNFHGYPMEGCRGAQFHASCAEVDETGVAERFCDRHVYVPEPDAPTNGSAIIAELEAGKEANRFIRRCGVRPPTMWIAVAEAKFDRLIELAKIGMRAQDGRKDLLLARRYLIAIRDAAEAGRETKGLAVEALAATEPESGAVMPENGEAMSIFRPCTRHFTVDGAEDGCLDCVRDAEFKMEKRDE